MIVTLWYQENKNKTITNKFQKLSNGYTGVKHTNQLIEGTLNDDVEWMNDLNVNSLWQLHDSNKHSC